MEEHMSQSIFFPIKKKKIIQFFKSLMDFDYHYFIMTMLQDTFYMNHHWPSNT